MGEHMAPSAPSHSLEGSWAFVIKHSQGLFLNKVFLKSKKGGKPLNPQRSGRDADTQGHVRWDPFIGSVRSRGMHVVLGGDGELMGTGWTRPGTGHWW